MTAVLLALWWLGSGLVVTAMARVLRRARLVVVGPLLGGLGTLAVATNAPWAGPLSSTTGHSVELTRPAVGLLLAAGLSLAATLALAPRVDGGEAATIGAVAAASVVALAATGPAIWSIAVAVGVAVLAVRWVTRTPGRSTLASGRIACLGAASLLAAAPFLAAATPPGDPRQPIAGALLAAGEAALLGLLPIGGWAAALMARVRASDVAPWALVVAPVLLLVSVPLLASLPAGARSPFADVLLVLGTGSAVYGAWRGALAPATLRYRRLLLSDLALAAAGIGTGHAAATTGLLVVLVTHLLAAPLLLHGPRPGTHRAARLAWLALSGVLPAPSFWSRLLVFRALGGTSLLALGVACAAGVGLLVTAIRGMIDPLPAGATRTNDGVRLLGWGLAVATAAVGVAPAAIAVRIFGIGGG